MTINSSVEQFFNTKLRDYSAGNCVRGIPSIDGFKASQRKAIWGVYSRGENAGFDSVERVASHAASVTNYHHGVGSMCGTIVKLAQDFPGSNNIPLLEGDGQFGNRISSTSGAPRYIQVKLSSNYRKYFLKADDIILKPSISDGVEVEPECLISILPMVLVNGARGMGTGHATVILQYKPADIRAAIDQLLRGKTLVPFSMVPYWEGFKGKVTRDLVSGQVTIYGIYEIQKAKTKNVLVISELPIGVQSDDYKDTLLKLEERGIIAGFENTSEEFAPKFRITFPDETDISTWPEDKIHKTFKLVARESENCTVWNSQGFIQQFASVEAVLVDWVKWRLEKMAARRTALIAKAEKDSAWLQERARFIKFYLANVEFFKTAEQKVLNTRLTDEGFTRIDDLLSTPMRALTKAKIDEMELEIINIAEQLERLKADKPVQMLNRDLKELKL